MLFCVKWFGFLFFGNKITPDGLFSFCDRPSFRCTVCFRFATYCLSALQLVFILRQTVLRPFFMFPGGNDFYVSVFCISWLQQTFTRPFFTFPGENRPSCGRTACFNFATDCPASVFHVFWLQQTFLRKSFRKKESLQTERLQALNPFVFYILYSPLKSTPSNTRDGIRRLDDNLGSLPTSTRLFHSVIILPVIFISEIGFVSFPFSIRKPSTP